jgi:antitoxin HicB
MKNNNPYIGSSLDDLLDEDNILKTVNEIAIKRVIALAAKTRNQI